MLGAELAVHIGGGHFYDLLLLETAGCGLHHRESVGQHLVENFLYLLVDFLCQLVHLCSQRLLSLDWNRDVLQLLAKRFFTLFVCSYLIVYYSFYSFCLGSETIVRKFVYPFIGGQHLIQYRPDLLHVPLGFRTENFLQKTIN